MHRVGSLDKRQNALQQGADRMPANLITLMNFLRGGARLGTSRSKLRPCFSRKKRGCFLSSTAIRTLIFGRDEAQKTQLRGPRYLLADESPRGRCRSTVDPHSRSAWRRGRCARSAFVFQGVASGRYKIPGPGSTVPKHPFLVPQPFPPHGPTDDAPLLRLVFFGRDAPPQVAQEGCRCAIIFA